MAQANQSALVNVEGAGLAWRFQACVFLSAFLLFQVQPIMGRYVLPRFGGGPAVWTACMLFFQIVLLGGYAYAHWIGTRPDRGLHSLVHAALLLGSLAFLPIGPRSGAWKAAESNEPTAQILLLLTASIGLPYLVLSSTAPLLQRWFSVTVPGRQPYRLYALSNVGSFIALVSYPFVVEPELTLRTQAFVWSVLYVAFVGVCMWCAWTVRLAAVPLPVLGSRSAIPRPQASTILFWLGLSACGSALLLATTNQMCQEVAVVPFLWLAPLSIYLLTFILSFAGERWYPRSLFAISSGVMVLAACAFEAASLAIPLWAHILIYSLTLFSTCMLCHGELARSKPDPAHLTMFFLLVAAGGALGGIFVAVVAPRIFVSFAEFPIALGAACVLGIAGWLRTGAWREWRGRSYLVRASLSALLFGAITPAIALQNKTPNARGAWRNFYGILRLTEVPDEDDNARLVLTHGRIMHGFQYLDPSKRLWPTSYYGPDSGVSLALAALGNSNRHVGVIGLGTGTLAAYGRPGDTFRFYEINPDVRTIASRRFSYLRDSKAGVTIVMGDARVQLERELSQGQPQNFDALAVDAFSSDAIPLHLITAECGEIYRKHLRHGGVLLFHISNRSLHLGTVTRGLANHLGWSAALIVSAADPSKGESVAQWVLITSNREFLNQPEIKSHISAWNERDRQPILWTDDFASLWHVLKF